MSDKTHRENVIEGRRLLDELNKAVRGYGLVSDDMLDGLRDARAEVDKLAEARGIDLAK